MKHYIAVSEGAGGFDLLIKMPITVSDGFVFFQDEDGQDWKISMDDVVEIGTVEAENHDVENLVMNEYVVSGEFVSKWDGGIEVVTSCKVNLETKKVFDIGTADVGDLDVCEGEYVRFCGEIHDIEEYVDGYYYIED